MQRRACHERRHARARHAMQNMMPTPATQMPGGTGYDDSSNAALPFCHHPMPTRTQRSQRRQKRTASPAPQDLTLPEGAPKKPAEETKPAAQPPLPHPHNRQLPQRRNLRCRNRRRRRPSRPSRDRRPTAAATTSRRSPATPTRCQRTALPRAQPTLRLVRTRPQRQPVFMRNASRPNNPQTQQCAAGRPAAGKQPHRPRRIRRQQ